MNATSASARRAGSTRGNFALAGSVALVQGLRLILFAVFAICAPLLCGLMGFCAVVCFLTCGFYALVAPPGLRFPYAIGLALGGGCAVVAVTCDRVVRALDPDDLGSRTR